MVEEILTYSNKLGFLIEALVKTSRLESGVFQFLPREQSLSELAQKVCDAGAERAEAQQVIICPDATCDETVTAFFDEKWTTEAVGNILDNALKYSPAGSQVSVSLFSFLVCPTLFHHIFRLYACFQSINRHFTLTPSGVLQE